MATGFVNALGYEVPFSVTFGGTGASSFTAYSVICAGTSSTGAFQNVSGVGTAGQVLTSGGASSLPTWEDPAGGSISSWKNAVFAASTANYVATYSNGTAGVGATLTNNDTQAAFSIDGETPSVGERVLIKNQTDATENGIYSVTDAGSGVSNWVLTRVTDYDQVAEINPGDAVLVQVGTANANSVWWQTNTIASIGGDDIAFTEFVGAGVQSVSGTSNRITVTGTTNVTIDIAATYVGQTSITTLGTVATGTWNATTIDVAHGGTSATTFTAYSPVFAGTTATGAFQSISVGTAGQVLTSAGAGALAAFADPTVKLPFVSVSGTTQTAAKNTAYGLQNASQVTVTLPASAGLAVGDVIQIEGYGAAGFVIQAVGSQVVNAYGGKSTTTAGTVTTRDAANTTNSAPGCAIVLRYTATDTFWMAPAAVGNFAFA